jgi:GntR family transcriptional regulator, transcriptional repressor for pyruvate dehydrogenase complex
MSHDESGEIRSEMQVTAASSVAEALASIIQEQLPLGARLPSEAELATRFQVSRVTIREAVKMLAGRGLLELARGRRAVVREPTGLAFSDFLVSLIRNDPKGLFDLMELRMVLETQSAALAAQRASRAGLQSLEAAVQGMRDNAAALATDSPPQGAEERFHDYDVQFHEALATAGANRVLAFLFEAMTAPLRQSFLMSRRGQEMRGATREETIAAHQAIVEAVRAGDQRAAREAMQVHLRDTENDIRAHVANHRP